jgi:hypothetical protein
MKTNRLFRLAGIDLACQAYNLKQIRAESWFADFLITGSWQEEIIFARPTMGITANG